LNVIQPVKTFSAPPKLKFHYRTHGSTPSDAVLRQFNPAYIVITYFSKANFNLNVTATPSSEIQIIALSIPLLPAQFYVRIFPSAPCSNIRIPMFVRYFISLKMKRRKSHA